MPTDSVSWQKKIILCSHRTFTIMFVIYVEMKILESDVTSVVHLNIMCHICDVFMHKHQPLWLHDKVSLSVLSEVLSLFPMRWHFVNTLIDPFQGCYKDGTEWGMAEYRLFAQFGLYFRIAFFAIYMLTLTSLYFMNAAIAITLWLILLINVNPFKKHVSF